MLWPYAWKAFGEKLNLLNIDDDEITLKDKLEVTTIDITLKKSTCGAVQFMSWMKYFKVIYLDYPSGDSAHLQRYILVSNHFMRYQ